MILPNLSTRVPGGALSAQLLVGGRQFPASLGAWNSAFPSVTAPIGMWPMQDSISPAVDTIGGFNLSVGGGLTGDEYFLETGDPYGRYGIKLEDIASNIRAATNAVLDQTTGSFSMFFRFASVDAPVSGHYFARKKSVSTNTNGWAIEYVNASGHLRLFLDSPASALVSCTISLNFADALYHDILCVVDRGAANLMSLITDLGTASVDISAHAGGSLTNTTFFGFGDTNGNGNRCARVQYTYGAFFNYAVSAVQFATIRAGS